METSMTKSPLIALLLVALTGCADEAPIAGLLCPCGSGYTCCADNVCVPEGNACSSRTDAPDALRDRPCSSVERGAHLPGGEMDWTYLYDSAGLFRRGDGTSPDGRSSGVQTMTHDTAGHTTSMDYT